MVNGHASSASSSWLSSCNRTRHQLHRQSCQQMVVLSGASSGTGHRHRKTRAPECPPIILSAWGAILHSRVRWRAARGLPRQHSYSTRRHWRPSRLLTACLHSGRVRRVSQHANRVSWGLLQQSVPAPSVVTNLLEPSHRSSDSGTTSRALSVATPSNGRFLAAHRSSVAPTRTHSSMVQ